MVFISLVHQYYIVYLVAYIYIWHIYPIGCPYSDMHVSMGTEYGHPRYLLN